MFSASYSAPLTAINLSGKTVSTPKRHVRFRPIVSSATASANEARTSYLDSHGMASCPSLYETLGIPSAASSQEIKAAYRRLARVCHPDMAAVGRKNSSADEFLKIHAAYSTLSDPEKRASYDKSLVRRRQVLTTTASRFSGYTGRNWETDQCW